MSELFTSLSVESQTLNPKPTKLHWKKVKQRGGRKWQKEKREGHISHFRSTQYLTPGLESSFSFNPKGPRFKFFSNFFFSLSQMRWMKKIKCNPQKTSSS